LSRNNVKHSKALDAQHSASCVPGCIAGQAGSYERFNSVGTRALRNFSTARQLRPSLQSPNRQSRPLSLALAQLH
jgi:hypothetical protein